MERMLVVVFDDETKAYEGSKALTQLGNDGSISIYAGAVVKKNTDGTIDTKESGDDFPIRAIGGSAIGALIGVLGGPIGFGLGAAGGAIVGGTSDVRRARVNEDFLREVSAKLTPGKWAVVSDVSEEWVTPVDTAMEPLGGTVYRTARKDFESEQHAEDIAALRTEVAQLKAEEAKSRVDQKAKLQAKIDRMQERLRAKLVEAKQSSEQEEDETKAKLRSLQEKAAKAKGGAKAVIEARVADIRKEASRAHEGVSEKSTKVRNKLRRSKVS